MILQRFLSLEHPSTLHLSPWHQQLAVTIGAFTADKAWIIAQLFSQITTIVVEKI